MTDKDSTPKNFNSLSPDDTDLVMFRFQDLTLEKRNRLVIMTMVLKRKVLTELLTTYLPTILLLLISFVTIFFDEHLFGDAIAVNLTIMLMMTTIFTSKMEELPATSDTKMIDIWLIFCLIIPFLDVILSTAINSMMNCSCHFCEARERVVSRTANAEQKEGADKTGTSQRSPPGEVLKGAWLDKTDTKVAPQQVVIFVLYERNTDILKKLSLCDR